MIREEMKRESGLSQFGFNSVAFHTHNGVDSPPIVLPTLTFVGKIPAVPLASFQEYFLPAGWSVSFVNSDDGYHITHNLGSTSLGVVVTPYTSASVGYSPFVLIDSPNQFTVYFYDLTPSSTNSPFFFMVTQFDNPLGSFSPYSLIKT